MARMSNHVIVERWRYRSSSVVFHVTKTGRILCTTGPKMGGAQILMQKKYNDGSVQFRPGLVPPQSGWERANTDDWKKYFTYFGECRLIWTKDDGWTNPDVAQQFK